MTIFERCQPAIFAEFQESISEVFFCMVSQALAVATTKIYGVHLHPIPIPARERDARKDHQNFFFDQEAYVREMGAQHGFNYMALRPQLVTGPTPGALNVVPAIGVYAAIRREKGEPFGFPGGPSFVWEAADADLVADVMVWAAQSPQAANEAFNITNGDVFEWRNVRPAMAETLGVETGPDMPTSVATYLEENADVWDQIVAKYDLRSRNLRGLVGYGDQHADFAFASGAPEGPRAFVSTIKLRQAGFTKTIDTEEAFRNALQSLIDHNRPPRSSPDARIRKVLTDACTRNLCSRLVTLFFDVTCGGP
jgi:nucleoside-diphosphate-sugar epimerase